MKKILAVTLTLALCISMLAVPAMAEEKTTPSICIVVAGGLGDRSFYDSANEGIEQLKADYGTEIRVIECKEDASLYESSLIDAAEVSDVIAAVRDTAAGDPEMKLNSFVTVADASKVKVYMKNFGEFYNNQIESAGTIVLSRTQKLSQEKLEAAMGAQE